MNTIKISALMTCLLLGACSSVAPLTYGTKTYEPTVSEAEMQRTTNQIRATERSERKEQREERREEMMDTANAIKRANEGSKSVYIIR